MTFVFRALEIFASARSAKFASVKINFAGSSERNSIRGPITIDSKLFFFFLQKKINYASLSLSRSLLLLFILFYFFSLLNVPIYSFDNRILWVLFLAFSLIFLLSANFFIFYSFSFSFYFYLYYYYYYLQILFSRKITDKIFMRYFIYYFI